jgi:hypothetical protein
MSKRKNAQLRNECKQNSIFHCLTCRYSWSSIRSAQSSTISTCRIRQFSEALPSSTDSRRDQQIALISSYTVDAVTTSAERVVRTETGAVLNHWTMNISVARLDLLTPTPPLSMLLRNPYKSQITGLSHRTVSMRQIDPTTVSSAGTQNARPPHTHATSTLATDHCQPWRNASVGWVPSICYYRTPLQP